MTNFKNLIPFLGRKLSRDNKLTERGLKFANDLVGPEKEPLIDTDSEIIHNLLTRLNMVQAEKMDEIIQKRRIFYDKDGLSQNSKSLANEAVKYLKKGNVSFEAEELEDAVHNYLRVLEIDGNSVDAMRGLGDCFYVLMPILGSDEQGFGDKAVRCYQSALSFKEDVYILNAAGLVYELQKKQPEALMYYSRAVEVDPEYPETYHNRSRVFTALGKKTEAIADLEIFLSFDYWHKVEIRYAKEELFKLRAELKM